MAFVYFSGFETGDLSEWFVSSGTPAVATDQVTRGGYSLKLANISTSAAAIRTPTGLALSTSFARFNFFTSAATAGTATVVMTGRSTTTQVYTVQWNSVTGQITLNNLQTGAAVQIGSAFSLLLNQWYTIEVKCVVSATVGVLEMRVNGVVVATGSGLNTGTSNVDQFRCANTGSDPAGTGFYWFDDFIVSNSAYPGIGYCIARQGVAGTPNADAWTKNGAATAALCWSNTPFTTGTNCSNIGLNNAQTMLVGSFATAGSASEGTGLIATVDAINAGKTAFIAKATVAGNISIRRRVAGANTDTIKAVTTADAYYDDGIWTPTVTNLTAGTTEIGAVDDVAGVTDTVEDMWLIVDYIPLATLALPARRPAAQRRRIPRTKAKRSLRSNLARQLIPPAPAATLPIVLRRPTQRNRPAKQPRRIVRRRGRLFVEPQPSGGLSPILARKTQRNRPKKAPSRVVRRRSQIFAGAQPVIASPILRKTRRHKGAHVAKRRRAASTLFRIPQAPPVVTPTLPLPIVRGRHRRNKVVTAKRSRRAISLVRIPQAPAVVTPTLPLPIARGRHRRIKVGTSRRARRVSALVRIPQAPAVVTPTLPLPLRSRRVQRKTTKRARSKRALRVSITPFIPSPPLPPPVPFPGPWIVLRLTQPIPAGPPAGPDQAIIIFQERIESVTPSLMVQIYSSSSIIPRSSAVTVTAKVTLPDGINPIPGMLPVLYIYSPGDVLVQQQTMNPTGDKTLFQLLYFIQPTAPTGAWAIQVVSQLDNLALDSGIIENAFQVT